MYLCRDQTCAVEEVLGDLCADPDQHLGGQAGSHDQSLGGAPP
jgi:hypothetical protein